jgi:hypothetical protein
LLRASYMAASRRSARWALAVYWPEEPPASFLGPGPLVAPEEFNPFAWAVAKSVVNPARVPAGQNDPDATAKALGIPGPGLPFQLNGGLEAEYGAPIRTGDVITSVLRLVEYREREGSLGRMLFTVTEDEWANQDGELVKPGRLTLTNPTKVGRPRAARNRCYASRIAVTVVGLVANGTVSATDLPATHPREKQRPRLMQDAPS